MTIELANYAFDNGRNLNDQSFGPLGGSKINILPKKAPAQVFTPPYQEVAEEEESQQQIQERTNSNQSNKIVLHFDNADPKQTEKVPHNIETTLRDHGKDYFAADTKPKVYTINGEDIPVDELK